ncbi:MAG: sodium:solute symporter family protein [Bacteroidia bacterium]|nr:sodium:solute symporter family protein [Bacteroidia bacterium]MDW8334392.1 sodium:solute symporter family protein [Bacteroidia bacterium]
MTAWAMALYVLATLAVGLWAARRVRNQEDYLLAGRGLNLPLAAATVFATWFGAETILGSSAHVAREGLIAAVVDPLGAALCLILVGLFFAKPLYDLRLSTIGDFFRLRFGRTAELVASVCLVVSYLGWLGGQMVALGLVGRLAFGWEPDTGIVLGALVVTFYTFVGGMWSIAVLDLVQNAVLIAGLFAVTALISGDGTWNRVARGLPPGFTDLLPHERSWLGWLNYGTAWMTVGLGSIPQQDVFQRVMASDSRKTAVRASIVGGAMYLTVGLIPLALAAYLRVEAPHALDSDDDAQQIILRLIVERTPAWTQALFLGALTSAVLSTASAALLAPAAIMSENLIRPLFPRFAERRLLALTRACVALIAAVSLAMALVRKDIHELVAESSALSLVSLFVPLCAGLWMKRHSSAAAVASMVSGMAAWFAAFMLETALDPLLYGSAASVAAYASVYFWLRRREAFRQAK